MHNFRKLNIWIEARILVKEVYQLTARFPSDERFGLEGSARSTNKDFANFLRISLGSLYELETQLILAVDLGIISDKATESTIQKIIILQKMISNFIKTLI